MRSLAAGALVFALGLLSARGNAAQPTPQSSPEEAHIGCIRQDLRPCMITLGSALWFEMSKVTPQLASRNELDVNGKTAHRKITILAAVPGHNERFTITLTLASPAPNDLVVKAEAWLPWDPDLAHTQSDYDKTYMFDAVAPLLGRRCPNLDRLTLYRFFENSVKPREIREVRVVKRGIFNHTIAEIHTDRIPFCGVMFSLFKHAEWEGTPELPSSTRDGGAAILINLE